MSRCHRGWLLVALLTLASGCGIAPKSFQKIVDPAPLTRARSVGLADTQPTRRAIPALIERLNDPDPVVRLAAFEELKHDTGQSFGYVPWAHEGERAEAVARWNAWWKTQEASLARSR